MLLPRRTLVAVVFLAVAAPVSSWLIGRLPGPQSPEAAGLAGFILGLLPLAGLAVLVLFARLSRALLLALLVTGLPVGIALSAGGLLFWGAPWKVLAALCFGKLVGREVVQAWWLALAAAIAFAVDIWSVFAGPTRAVVERAPAALDYLVVHFPGWGMQGPATGLGMSDFVFLGLLTAGAAAAQLRPRAVLAAGLSSFVLTLVLALLTDRPLPALPLLCVAFLAVNVDLLFRRPRLKNGADAG